MKKRVLSSNEWQLKNIGPANPNRVVLGDTSMLFLIKVDSKIIIPNRNKMKLKNIWTKAISTPMYD